MSRTLLIAVTAFFVTFFARAGNWENNFQHPPANARPWVYWFWNNGNVTSNGITADLEAMQRVGIGGVLIMDVVQPFAPPRGTAEFMDPEWRALFQFSVEEAGRLGLEINMANGPGWCGSSGPWITPELSMLKLVETNITLVGPTNFRGVLPQPGISNKSRHAEDAQVQYADFYRDVALLATPDGPGNAALNLGSADGIVDWDVPPGKWTLERIGYTTTGSTTRPPVAGGNGLECDKLSREAMAFHFAHMMTPLIANAGSLAGKSLVATHIDSWEIGSQNWTPKFREEFSNRRGYDPLLWLPCIFGHNIDGTAAANRFRWDFNQTIAELLAENYSGGLAQEAHKRGLRYTLEGYNLPFGDEFTYTARTDEPMTEFWTQARPGQNETYRKASQMASVAHVYGRTIVGAESFTSGNGERWELTPADIKALGDFEFSQGVNRFVIHRYAHQPYLDRAPGATMGPWGLHYERTQTWWEMSRPWHEYLARCQYLLRQGKFVADLLYLRPEQPNQTYFNPHPKPPAGYRFDEISAEALIQRASVKKGKLVLPDGMSYRALVLPDEKTMTPALARKLLALARAGAVIVTTGAPPASSPSLQDFPECDALVAKLGQEIWAKRHASLTEALSTLKLAPDFAASIPLNWVHRQGDGTDIYFVANPSDRAVEAYCTFRVKGQRPELWNPETGAVNPLALYDENPEGISMPLRLGPSGSAFIVFRHSSKHFDSVVAFERNGEPLSKPPVKSAHVTIQRASYGVPGDPRRTRDVRAKVEALVENGETAFAVAEMARGDDPAYGVVKTLSVDYLIDGNSFKACGQDTDTVRLEEPGCVPGCTAELLGKDNGRLELIAHKPGLYEWQTASGKMGRAEIATVPSPLEIPGPWRLSFPPGKGAPGSVTLTNLISWPDSTDEGVRHFSGTATYATTFELPAAVSANDTFILELGAVHEMARVILNGHDCGIAWKAPYSIDATAAVRPGENQLQIQVVNLWPNRMIGDSALPESRRMTWSSWEPFRPDSPLLPSGLLGPVKLVESRRIENF